MVGTSGPVHAMFKIPLFWGLTLQSESLLTFLVFDLLRLHGRALRPVVGAAGPVRADCRPAPDPAESAPGEEVHGPRKRGGTAQSSGGKPRTGDSQPGGTGETSCWKEVVQIH